MDTSDYMNGQGLVGLEKWCMIYWQWGPLEMLVITQQSVESMVYAMGGNAHVHLTTIQVQATSSWWMNTSQILVAHH